MQFLEQADFIFLIDVSGSMRAPEKWSSLNLLVTSLWKNTHNQKNDLCFFNDSPSWFKQVSTEEKILELFHTHFPEGNTNTDLALKQALNKHFYRQKSNSSQKTKILLFTDGTPDNESHVLKRLKEIALKLKKMEKTDSKLIISVFQIGDDDKMNIFFKSLADKFPTLVSIATD